MKPEEGGPGPLRGGLLALALAWVAGVVLLHLAVARLGVHLLP
jgi:hypothetical protein